MAETILRGPKKLKVHVPLQRYVPTVIRFNSYPHTYLAGRIRICFERSTLPEHVGTRTVVIRVLDILDPIEPIDPAYDRRLAPPQQGELLYTLSGKAISFQLDGGIKGSRGKDALLSMLRLLWEADTGSASTPNCASSSFNGSLRSLLLLSKNRMTPEGIPYFH